MIDVLHQADIDVLELDLGLARLQTLGGLEVDGDGRAALGDRRVGEPTADQDGHDRNDPHDREAPAALLHRDFAEPVVRLCCVLIGHPSSPRRPT